MGLTIAETLELKQIVEELERRQPLWTPQAGNLPQQAAFKSEAQIIFYGGKAGGGKTEWLIGKSTMHGRHVLFLRRTFPQFERILTRFRELVGPNRVVGDKFIKPETGKRGVTAKMIKLGHIQYDKDAEQYQGGERDIVCFDEITHFSERVFTMLMTWNRSTALDEDGNPIKTQILAAGNPPISTEGLWVIGMWGPWLDPQNEHFPTPSGAILWRYSVNDVIYWKKDGEPVTVDPKDGTPLSRVSYPISFTFIAAGYEDNPLLANDAEYLARLDMLPPELRAAMRDGDFQNSLMDQPMQIVPIAAYRAAVERWKKGKKEGQQTALGCDVARGGADWTVISEWYGHRCETLYAYPGVSTNDGDMVVSKLLDVADRKTVPISIDVVGVGGSAYDVGRKVFEKVYPYAASGASLGVDMSGQFEFLNKNAQDWWRFREALIHPDSEIEIPDHPRLFSEICGRQYKISNTGKLQVEKKEDYIKRAGSSPDYADGFIIGFSMRGIFNSGGIKWG